jgi:hypothetical protein
LNPREILKGTAFLGAPSQWSFQALNAFGCHGSLRGFQSNSYSLQGRHGKLASSSPLGAQSAY